MSPKSILITSASGNIGRSLIPLLLSTTSEETTLVLPTASATRLTNTLSLGPNPSPRLRITEGAVSDPIWLEETTRSNAIDTVFLNLGGPDELYTTLGALDAFDRAGVKHLIYLSCAGEFTSPEGSREFLSWNSSASVVVKVAVEQKLWSGKYGFTWTVVGPTLFFENDVRTLGLLLNEGIMPEPLGEMGVSRVSCGDVARVVAKGIEDGGMKLHRRKVNVGSLRRYSGSETEGLWSRALGREIRMFKGDEEGLRAYERSWMDVVPGKEGRAFGRDLSMMCRGWVASGYGLSEDEYRLTRAVLGKETDDYAEWVAETGRKLIEEEERK